MSFDTEEVKQTVYDALKDHIKKEECALVVTKENGKITFESVGTAIAIGELIAKAAEMFLQDEDNEWVKKSMKQSIIETIKEA